jgi:hypothetical protein
MWNEEPSELIATQWDETTDANGDSYYIGQSIVYSMDAFNAEVKLRDVDTYLDNRNPFTTSGKYKFKIGSLSGSGKTVTATLSKAVTADQLAGAKYNAWDLSKMDGKSFSFDVALRDTKTDEFITATATIKSGSKTVTIKTKKSLTKGRKYELMAWDYSDWGITDWSSTDADWLRNDWIHTGKYTFTAK